MFGQKAMSTEAGHLELFATCARCLTVYGGGAGDLVRLLGKAPLSAKQLRRPSVVV